MTFSKEQKLRMCVGCSENFYNGNNPLGVKECWNLKSAKVVLKKAVPIWQAPPWNQPAEKVLSCLHRDGYVMVEPKAQY